MLVAVNTEKNKTLWPPKVVEDVIYSNLSLWKCE